MKYFSEFLYEANKSGDSSLRDWFSKSRASDGTPGWVQLGGKYAGKPCAKQPGQTTKPKCGSSKMKANLSDEEEDKAFRRKNRQDPNPDRKGKAKNVATEEVKKDHEFSMARSQLKTLKNAANRLQKKMGKKGEGELKAWVQSKITKATDYIDTAADYVTNEQYITQQQKAERYAQKFVNQAKGAATRYDAAKKAAQKVKTTPGSVTIRSNIPEGVNENFVAKGKLNYGSTPGKATDKSVSSAVDRAIANKGTAVSASSEKGKTGVTGSGSISYSGRIRIGGGSDNSKRKPNKPNKPNQKPTTPKKPNPTTDRPRPIAARPRPIASRPRPIADRSRPTPTRTNTPTSGSSRILMKNSYQLEGGEQFQTEGKKDACYHKVKARYDVWPSAYASGALVKCRKKGAKNWGNKTKKEEVQYENYSRIQSRGTTYSILLNWMGRVLSVQMFFPKFTRPTKEEVTFEVKKLYPGARVLSFNPSLKDPTKPLLYTGDTQ